MTNSILEAQRLGQSVWYDNIRRGLLTSCEMRRLIELGVTGVTLQPDHIPRRPSQAALTTARR